MGNPQSNRLASLVEAARTLVPDISAAQRSYTGDRDLPVRLVEQMKEAGLHKAYMPARFGGYELDWGAHYHISREISQACGSAGWVAGLVFSHVMFIPRFPELAQEAFFAASPHGILATASAGAGVLQLFRRLDRRLFVYYLMQDYAFTARDGGAYPAVLEERLRFFGKRSQTTACRPPRWFQGAAKIALPNCTV